MSDVTAGKKTSEFKFSYITTAANLLVSVGGALLLTLDPANWPAVVVGAVVAVANTFLSSAYTKGRSIVKAAALANPTETP